MPRADLPNLDPLLWRIGRCRGRFEPPTSRDGCARTNGGC